MRYVYYDIEKAEYLTEEMLKSEYEFLKLQEKTEARTYDEYRQNCLSKNGTLEYAIR